MQTSFLKVTGDYIMNDNQIRSKESCSHLSLPSIDSDINKQVFGNQDPMAFVGCFKFGGGTGIIANTRQGAGEETSTSCFIG